MTSGHLPGQRSERTYTPRRVLLSTKGVIFERGIIDATYAYDGANTSYEDELRPGTLMAQITATKLWVPCRRTTVTAGGSGSASAQGTSSVIVVRDARAFKAGDVLTVGNNTSVTVSSIDYATNRITISAPISYDTNEIVIATSLAGSEICRGILNEFVKLKDTDGTWRDKSFGEMIIAGYVDDNQVLGDLDAVLAATHHLSQIQFGINQAGL